MSLPAKTSEQSSALSRFFFAKETPFGLALVRMLLPLACGFPMFMRFPQSRLLYTTDGSPVQMYELFGHGAVLPVLPPGVAIPLYSLMLACFVCLSIGFCTRVSAIAAAVLYIYFNFMDGVGTMTKYSVIASHMLVLLSVSQAGVIWSVDAWLARRRNPQFRTLPPRVAVWPMRLMQILFAHIYFGAAITKIQTASFFSGEQMRYWMLSNWNYENPVGEMMAMWSPLLLVSAYISVVWEMMFPFLAWRPRGRFVALGMGVMFHFMTWLTLGLYVFPAICISSYFGYMNEKDFLFVRNWAARLRVDRWFVMPLVASERGLTALPRMLPAPAVWASLVAVATLACTEAELRMDIYGRNTAEGGYRLKPMDPLVARTMIKGSQPLREQDKYFSFEIGTMLVGNQLANRRAEFEFGETMIAQANLNPPHEDMWVECLLQDDEGRTIEQFGQFVTREKLKTNFIYEFGSKLVPGDYFMVLKSANKEVYRRPFVLTGTPPAQYRFSDVTN
ncbi:MAG: HTTM domain-containing protein [Planctomycetaceae bacterium]|nr:HTTM domain-containing protein [Planctomycetaceae bacterium]